MAIFKNDFLACAYEESLGICNVWNGQDDATALGLGGRRERGGEE